MNIGEAAEKAGVSVRTLRYYDEIGLLRPAEVTEAGYRVYDDAALVRLQEILFYRELDFPLADVKRILASPDYDRAAALQKQQALLLQRRARLDGLIRLVEQSMKGENMMSIQEFDTTAIEAAQQQYAAEAKEKWGKTEAYAQSAARTKRYDKADWARIQTEADAILRDIAAIRDEDPAGARAKELVGAWRAHITQYYYDCTVPILKGLGEMYTADERFTAYLDRFGDGTAQFLSEAIRAFS